MKIVWGEFPDDQREQLEPLIERYRYLLPDWLGRLDIEYDDGDESEEYYAAAHTEYLYREATLYITPTFWSLDADGRAATVAHEAGHILLAPLDREFSYLLGVLENDALYQTSKQRYAEAVEAVVSDLALTATR